MLEAFCLQGRCCGQLVIRLLLQQNLRGGEGLRGTLLEFPIGLQGYYCGTPRRRVLRSSGEGFP